MMVTIQSEKKEMRKRGTKPPIQKSPARKQDNDEGGAPSV